MAYFKYLPNVYIRNRALVNGVHPYELTKNIFRRIKIRDDLQGALLGFIQYEIGEGERPDQVAHKVYGKADYDWIVLLTNNIINVNEDWPLTRYDLLDYVQNKYGSIEGVSHYETNEIKATSGEVLVPEGIQCNESFQYKRADGTLVPKDQSRKAVSYYEAEHAKNEEKRNIYLLRDEYVNDFVKEFRKLCAYLPHGEIDTEGNKKTPTTLAEEYLGISNYRKPSQSTASTGSASGSGSSTALISSGGGGGTATQATIIDDTSSTTVSQGGAATTSSQTTGSTQSDNTATSSGSDTNLGGYGY